MRHNNNRLLTLMYIIFIVAALWLAWWVAGEYYKPYPPATPTPTYWPTRATSTIVPSVTPTEVIHTPVQPTIGYTETPYEPPVTITNTPQPISTFTPMPTGTPVAYAYPIQKYIECQMWVFRGNRVMHYLWCRSLPGQAVTGTPRGDGAIWWEPIPPQVTAAPFTGSPIFTP